MTMGFFGGGRYSGTISSSVQRINFNNETATYASIRGPLTFGRYQASAVGNGSYGYYGGGMTPGPVVSTVDRLDYSNDNSAASPKGPLSA